MRCVLFKKKCRIVYIKEFLIYFLLEEINLINEFIKVVKYKIIRKNILYIKYFKVIFICIKFVKYLSINFII